MKCAAITICWCTSICLIQEVTESEWNAADRYSCDKCQDIEILFHHILCRRFSLFLKLLPWQAITSRCFVGVCNCQPLIKLPNFVVKILWQAVASRCFVGVCNFRPSFFPILCTGRKCSFPLSFSWRQHEFYICFRCGQHVFPSRKHEAVFACFRFSVYVVNGLICSFPSGFRNRIPE